MTRHRDHRRYFLTTEREVTKAEYVAEERRQGFHNTLGQPDEPATASFSSSTSTTRGRLSYEACTCDAPPHPASIF